MLLERSFLIERRVSRNMGEERSFPDMPLMYKSDHEVGFLLEDRVDCITETTFKPCMMPWRDLWPSSILRRMVLLREMLSVSSSRAALGLRSSSISLWTNLDSCYLGIMDGMHYELLEG